MEEIKSYTVSQETTPQGDTDVCEIAIRMPGLNKLLKTKAMTQDSLIKFSKIEVPNTPFTIMICFIGRENTLIEIYLISSTNVILQPSFRYKIGDCDRAKFIEINKNFMKIVANERYIITTLRTADCRLYNHSGPLYLRFTLISIQTIKENNMNEPEPKRSDFVSDFALLLAEGSYSDVVLKSLEGEVFNVHKNILAIRSCVLKAHFECNLSESHTNVVQTNFESDILRDVLSFLYTDKAPLADQYPEKLWAAADFYQIQGLKNLCEISLKRKLCVENAMQTLHIAELYDIKQLKLWTLEFIKNEGVRAIIDTEGWINNNSASLVKLIYEYIMADVSTNILALAYEQVYD